MADTIDKLVTLLDVAQSRVQHLESIINRMSADHASEIADIRCQVPRLMEPDEAARLIGSIATGGLIAAIKMHRHVTHCGLKDAKDAVERHWPAKPDAC